MLINTKKIITNATSNIAQERDIALKKKKNVLLS